MSTNKPITKSVTIKIEKHEEAVIGDSVHIDYVSVTVDDSIIPSKNADDAAISEFIYETFAHHLDPLEPSNNDNTVIYTATITQITGTSRLYLLGAVYCNIQ